MERFVFMKKRLDAIAAGRDVVDAVDGPAAHAAIENRFFSWCEAVDVDAERDLGRRPVGNLEARGSRLGSFESMSSSRPSSGVALARALN